MIIFLLTGFFKDNEFYIKEEEKIKSTLDQFIYKIVICLSLYIFN